MLKCFVKVAVIFQTATYKYSDQKWYKTLGFYWKQKDNASTQFTIFHLTSVQISHGNS